MAGITLEALIRWIKRLVILVLGLIILAVLVASLYLWRSAPQDQGKLSLTGLDQAVEVRRDQYGLVEIIAESEKDAYFSMGYTDAQDRLYQMIMLRQLLKGRMSEWVGPDALNIDKYMRFIGFGRMAKSSYAAVKKKNSLFAKDTQAYCDGVNEFIKSQLIPPSLILVMGVKDIEPWEPEDAVLIQKVLAWDLTNNWHDKYANMIVRQYFSIDNDHDPINLLFPESQLVNESTEWTTLSNADLSDISPSSKSISERYTMPKKAITASERKLFDEFFELQGAVDKIMGEDVSRSSGSNMWAVSGSNTVSGMPQLANDPHLSLKAPNLFHLTSLEWPDHQLTGVSVPGGPIIIIGHNENIAWGFTNAHGDQTDLFYCDSSCPATRKTITETIKVKGQADVSYQYDQVVLFDRKEGEEGIEGGVIARVLPGSSGKAFLAWLGFDEEDLTLDSLHKLNHAEGIENMIQNKIFDDWNTPSQNIMIIDKDHIYYQLLGNVPNRTHTGQLPISLDDSATEWNGWVTNPGSLDGGNGRLINTNNFIVPSNYPFLLNGLVYDIQRQGRAYELINKEKKIAMANHSRWQMDTRSNEWLTLASALPTKSDPTIHPARWLSQIEDKVKNKGNQLEKDVLEKMKTWHNSGAKMDQDQISPTVFAVWSRFMIKDIYEHLDNRMAGESLKRFISYSPGFVSNVLNGDLKTIQLFGEGEDNPYKADSSLYLYQFYSKSVKELQSKLGDDVSKWTWNKVHTVGFKNSIGKSELLRPWVNRVMPISGGRDTLNRTRWYRNASDDDALSFVAKDGAAVRMIADASDFNNTQFMIPMGQSDHVFTSKHYDDLNSKWAAGDMIAYKDPKRSRSTYTLRLSPK